MAMHRTRLGALLLVLAATALLLAALAGPAAAAPVGQITSFGGYGLGTGQFANPTMLGVDPSDGSIYVGDLTEKGAEDREKYRIQKFSSTGSYEAKVEIPRFQDPPTDEKLVPLFGMAVDPTLHRLYVIEGGKTGAGEIGGEAYAKRILIFSTIPKEGKLVPPSEGPTSLPMPTGSELVVKPRTLAVDPATHEVEVMGETKTSPKHTIFQRVTSSGTLGASFVDSANNLRPGSEFAYSMAVGPTGKTYVLTGHADKKSGANRGETKAWELPPSLAEESEVPGFTAAEAEEEWPYGLEQNAASTFTGGPEMAISPDGSTLYWKERVEAASPTEAKAGNYLIHGFNLKEGATAQVYGGASGCLVQTQSAMLGVSGEGAAEHVVVLDPGPLNEEVQTSPAYGGKVLVFGRGGSGCPAPTAKFKVNGVEEGAEVEKGKTVTFDSSASELASGPAPTAGFRKEVIWKFGDGTEQVVTGSGGGEAPATVTHTYAAPGNYTATMRIRLKSPTYGNPLLVEHKVVVSSGVPEFTLTVTGHGSGSGTVTSSPGGIECGSKCSAGFEEGTLVKLTGTPAAGSQAVAWSGCDSVNGADECLVTMSAAKAVTATFNLEQHLLKVTKAGTGSGTVTSSPAGINCGTECEASFAHGTLVKLTGTPGGSSKAVVWSGCDAVNGSNECEVTMSAAKSVTATFATAGKNALAVTLSGSGSGTVTSTPGGISCGSTCSAEYTEGTVVKLTGAPASGSKAVVWSGCDAVVGANECEVTMSAAKSVTATFSLEQHLLKVTKAGSGSGTVTSSPGGINCGSTCEASFAHGTAVKLAGTAGAGSEPVAWSGCDAVVGANECEVTMSAAKAVTATFTARPRVALQVTAEGEGAGTVTSSPSGISCGTECSTTIAVGERVRLTAAPAAGSTFGGWSGCDAEPAANECEVTMSAAKHVFAEFAIGGIALTVARNGSGSGTVTSEPAGIDCGSGCKAGFAHGTAVVLTAHPAGDSVLTGWSGCETVAAGQCKVAMSASKTVTATFAKAGRLVVVKAGSGSGAVSSYPAGIGCGGTCEATFGVGANVILTAYSAPGTQEVVWQGCGSVNGSGQCLVTVGELTQVGAIFALTPTQTVTPPVETEAEAKQSVKQKELARCKQLEGVFRTRCIERVKKSGKKKSSKPAKKKHKKSKKSGKKR